MKRVLILTVTAGNGHNACAKSVHDKLNTIGEFEVKTVNLLKACSKPKYTWLTDRGYSIAVSHFMFYYNYLYRCGEKT